MALVVLACTFGGALVGMRIRRTLPGHHLDVDSRETIKLATGLIGTMTALVLGLVVSSAKAAFDADDEAVKHSAATVLVLDRLLARYGPETEPIRLSLRDGVAARLASTWPESGDAAKLDDPKLAGAADQLVARIHALTPATDSQRRLQSEALTLASAIITTRWSVIESVGSSIPTPFLAVLVFWLTLLFASFGLFAPHHGTAIGVLALSALSVSAAMFLILEMDGPFEGLIRVSSEPYRYALEHLAR
jgi:hypothetical protein